MVITRPNCLERNQLPQRIKKMPQKIAQVITKMKGEIF